jgi:hypothetical protein
LSSPGELLFVIDRQPYFAALAQAKAALAQSQATLEQAQHDLARAQSLTQIDAISQQELDAAVAQTKAGFASVNGREATLKTAELNLGYSSVHYFFRIGRPSCWTSRSCMSFACSSSCARMCSNIVRVVGSFSPK